MTSPTEHRAASSTARPGASSRPSLLPGALLVCGAVMALVWLLAMAHVFSDGAFGLTCGGTSGRYQCAIVW